MWRVYAVSRNPSVRVRVVARGVKRPVLALCGNPRNHGYVLKKLRDRVARQSPASRVEREARDEGRRLFDDQLDIRAAGWLRRGSWVDNPSGRDAFKRNG